MRVWMLGLLLMCGASDARAADVCPTLRSQLRGADPATRVAAIACNEHVLWYRPFIDRDGRLASATVSEAEGTLLGDQYSAVWRRVVGYWDSTGLLRQGVGSGGAWSCLNSAGLHDAAASPACRNFVVDTPWSAAFVSWVMVQAGLPGFRASASHFEYVRAAARNADSPWQLLDPASAKPAAGDLLCYVRVPGRVYGHAGLLASASSDAGLPMHCDIVVAANPDNDATAYLVGGNVQQGVTMRLLPLNRNGGFWQLPGISAGQAPCSPDNPEACSFNRQDWAALLRLKPPEALAQLPPAVPPLPSSTMPSHQAPACCINCVIGSGVPRCPRPGTDDSR